MTKTVPLRERASDQIFAALRDSICAGEPARGERLPTERELAARYGVSVNTVREAVRGLSLMGLVEVRHGSGAYVVGSASGVVGTSLGVLLRFEHVGLHDVVRLAGVLHRQVATSAVERATAADVAEFATAIEAIGSSSREFLPDQIERFLVAFAAAAHDPLLAALCGTLDRVVVTVTTDVVDGESPEFQAEIAALRPVRLRMLRALTDRHAADLLAATDEYQAGAERIVLARPELAQARLSDPRWAPLLAGLS